MAAPSLRHTHLGALKASQRVCYSTGSPLLKPQPSSSRSKPPNQLAKRADTETPHVPRVRPRILAHSSSDAQPGHSNSRSPPQAKARAPTRANSDTSVAAAKWKSTSVSASTPSSSSKKPPYSNSILPAEETAMSNGPEKPHVAPVQTPASGRRSFYDLEINHLYIKNQPSQAVLEKRIATMTKLSALIKEKHGERFDVRCFGSTAYGVDSSKSDIDLVIIDGAMMEGMPPWMPVNQLPKIYNVRYLSQILHRAGFIEVCSIPWASVPIVKFKDPETGVHVDMNVNDQIGSFNTQLVQEFCEASIGLRPLIFYIKYWAGKLGLNDPSGKSGEKSFSSYCLALMTIGALQSKRVILPGEALVSHESDNRGVFWRRVKGGGHFRCRKLEFSPVPEPRQLELHRALRAWFRYWGYEYRANHDAMCVMKGRVFPPPKPEGPTPVKSKAQPQPNESDERETGDVDGDVAGDAGAQVAEPMGEVRELTMLETMQVLGRSGDDQVSKDTITRTLAGDLIHREPDGSLLKLSSIADCNIKIMNLNLESSPSLSEAKESTTGSDVVAGQVEASQAEGASGELVPSESGGEAKAVKRSAQPWTKSKISEAWMKGPVRVQDPFFLLHNVAGNVKQPTFDRFQEECRRAFKIISTWGSPEYLFKTPAELEAREQEMKKVADAARAAAEAMARNLPAAKSIPQETLAEMVSEAERAGNSYVREKLRLAAIRGAMRAGRDIDWDTVAGLPEGFTAAHLPKKVSADAAGDAAQRRAVKWSAAAAAAAAATYHKDPSGEQASNPRTAREGVQPQRAGAAASAKVTTPAKKRLKDDLPPTPMQE
ncbi:hypothetical protein BOTBODRAFT_144456 [Botryobasidium botryosum FD-172 SS1]|uniref:Poly(A) RNA polymerase mitochondrial-like central palm domain-containing protein n=1 Tax=Botryobasidium botryosum (strain FD-172 SS1) TaxID=930990 RepID=A0A067MMA5_BOTB1|nr:hypothetical protein BOTBODRAFT_144456 [Botryobasidium botryosum FD-172 SS1]